jgi:hypothetical protein
VVSARERENRRVAREGEYRRPSLRTLPATRGGRICQVAFLRNLLANVRARPTSRPSSPRAPSSSPIPQARRWARSLRSTRCSLPLCLVCQRRCTGYSRRRSNPYSLMLKFAGIGEEELGEEIQDLLAAPDPTVAPLVSPGEVGQGEVHLRLTTRACTQEEANKKIEPVSEEVLSRLGKYYLGPRQA